MTTQTATLSSVLDGANWLLSHRALFPNRNGKALCGANVKGRDGLVKLSMSYNSRRRECGDCAARENGR